jgi:hypothetical protein
LASVTLHAEMEKHLRDDLAATKAAIAKIESAIANFGIWNGDENETLPPAAATATEESSGGEKDTSSQGSSLPAGILSDDTAELESSINAAEKEEKELRDRLPVLREVVSRMWEVVRDG